MQIDKLPCHVAIIMDGNGRWAQARGMSRTQGHMEGVKRIEEIIKTAHDIGIRFLTIYAFSTENWSRPQDEVSMIMRTFIAVLGQKAKELQKNGVRINFIGRRQGVPAEALKAMDESARITMNETDMTLNIAFNYGARGEIVDAVKSIVAQACEGKIKSEDVDEKLIDSHLYTKGQPDPDLLIRTSGEERISNFLLWQLSYAELYFTDKCWPEFNEEEFSKALATFARRERRWGKLKVSGEFFMSWSRFVSSVLMITLTALAVINNILFILVVVLLTAGGLYEFFYMVRKKDVPIYSYTGIFIGLLIPVSIFTHFEPTKNWELLFIVIGFLLILFMQFARKDNRHAILGLSTTLFGVLYVAWFFSFLVKIRLLLPGTEGVKLLGFLLLVTKGADVGALLIGSVWGKHPLLPKVSPNKSVEGTLGAVLVSACTALVFRSFLPPVLNLPLWQVFSMGAFFGGLGQLGDLSESLIKRDCGVKDSGKFLPGMGGVLDIIDSLLFSAPAFYLYMSSTLNTLQ